MDKQNSSPASAKDSNPAQNASNTASPDEELLENFAEPDLLKDDAEATDVSDVLEKAKNRVEEVDLSASESRLTGHKKSRLPLIFLLVFVTLAGAAGLVYYFYFMNPAPDSDAQTVVTPDLEVKEVPAEDTSASTPAYYSRLSGEEIPSETENSAPTFCVQIPNGVDGARPQAGLNSAKIVFEAIAEAGITRFAAIFQNPPAAVGPIRSLRTYYLSWDTPFDCTVVHAGGELGAIEMLHAGGYKELDESNEYMWRTAATYQLNRLWNNLFTSGDLLASYNNSKSYLSSDIKSFPRLSPTSAEQDRINRQVAEKLKIDTPATASTDTLAPKVTHIDIQFGYMPNFNPVYDYDAETNTYKRSYETGAPHTVYDCAGQSSGIIPESVCSEVQLNPSVVIVIKVQESLASDNYHEQISTLGAGDAYIFQNGDVIAGTWEKASHDAQIIFRDSEGNEIPLVPGQTWISAIPSQNSVEYN